MSSDLSITFGRFTDPIIGLCFAGKTKFVFGSLLVGLSISVPTLDIRIDFSESSNKRFLSIDSHNFDDFSPLLNSVTFFISLDYSGLHLIIILLSLLRCLRCQDIDIACVCKSISLLLLRHCYFLFLLCLLFFKLYIFKFLMYLRIDNI